MAAEPPAPECCMCGDRGLAVELFKCKNCLFRSQHRYCSDLYPRAGSYSFCNWCLGEDEGRMANESSYSLPSGADADAVQPLRGEFPLTSPIKKPRSPDRAKQPATLRRTRSGDMSHVVRTRQALRGKVRRYKLLEEVSS